jgi:hypothetical protein
LRRPAARGRQDRRAPRRWKPRPARCRPGSLRPSRSKIDLEDRSRLLAAARLLPGRLLGPALLAAAASGLLGRLLRGLLPSSCHSLGYPPCRWSRAPRRSTPSSESIGKSSGGRDDCTAVLLLPPIGGRYVRLEGILPSFPFETAALEPLLRLTVTGSFPRCQDTTSKKSRAWRALLRATRRLRREAVVRKEKFGLGGSSALALVAGALEQLALLVLAHLLAPLLDDASQGTPRRIDAAAGGYCLRSPKSTQVPRAAAPVSSRGTTRCRRRPSQRLSALCRGRNASAGRRRSPSRSSSLAIERLPGSIIRPRRR